MRDRSDAPGDLDVGGADPASPLPLDLPVGELVEVRVQYTDGWCDGFEVAAVVPGGYRVQRVSDGGLIPGPTGREDVRLRSPRPWGDGVPSPSDDRRCP